MAEIQLSCCDAASRSLREPTDLSVRPLLHRKIDLFMQSFVLPAFDPARICWWLSLSGGKDSFVMAHALRDWYGDVGIPFRARGFLIDQWGGASANRAARLIDWLPVEVIDAQSDTRSRTGYDKGQQAPCRACSDVRHDVTDALLDRAPPGLGDYHFIARGLHLSDIAVSLVWRLFWGLNPSRDMLSAGKGRPVAHISGNRYLAKPLSFAREFETQAYANSTGFRHACCGCPACRYPSRRDIVEETLLHFFRSDLWEFDVPGMSDFLSGHGRKIDTAALRADSAPGLATKHDHLPKDFADFAYEEMLRDLSVVALASLGKTIDFNSCLDEIGLAALEGRTSVTSANNIPAPAMLTQGDLTWQVKRATAALGPFWAAFNLPSEKRREALDLQRALFGIKVDEKLSNVHGMLRRYYGEA